MPAIDSAPAAANLKAAGTLAKIQLAVAGRMLKIANQQGDNALKLIESAAENMSSATADLNRSIGLMLDLRAKALALDPPQLLDRRRLPLDHHSHGGS
jgi:hypothetical protein